MTAEPVAARLPSPDESWATLSGTERTTLPLVVMPLTATWYVAPSLIPLTALAISVIVALVGPAVPLTTTSALEVKSTTGSLKVTVKSIGEPLVVVCPEVEGAIVTVGSVRKLTVVALAEGLDSLPAASVAASELTETMTVPSFVIPVTATL